jgi:hypothetical protein
MLEQKHPRRPPISFQSTDIAVAAPDTVHDVLRRNAAAIVAALHAGPLQFSDLLKHPELSIGPEESPGGLVGAFTYPQVFDVHGVCVQVGHTQATVRHETQGHILIVSDPMLSIESEEDDAK